MIAPGQINTSSLLLDQISSSLYFRAGHDFVHATHVQTDGS